MRVVTTCLEKDIATYGQRWLDARSRWPKGTQFWWFTEGYTLPYQPDEQQAIELLGLDGGALIERRDLRDIADWMAWRASMAHYVPPDWRFDIVRWSCKAFAALEAFKDYDGIGVWMDADCETYRDVPEGMIEAQVQDHYLACYQRTGLWTEAGVWIVNCGHPAHEDFSDFIREAYLQNRYKSLPQWHDCMILDAAIRQFTQAGRITVNNLSGEFHKHPHPQAMSELGKYFDHMKGARKDRGRSPENKWRVA